MHSWRIHICSQHVFWLAGKQVQTGDASSWVDHGQCSWTLQCKQPPVQVPSTTSRSYAGHSNKSCCKTSRCAWPRLHIATCTVSGGMQTSGRNMPSTSQPHTRISHITTQHLQCRCRRCHHKASDRYMLLYQAAYKARGLRPHPQPGRPPAAVWHTAATHPACPCLPDTQCIGGCWQAGQITATQQQSNMEQCVCQSGVCATIKILCRGPRAACRVAGKVSGKTTGVACPPCAGRARGQSDRVNHQTGAALPLEVVPQPTALVQGGWRVQLGQSAVGCRQVVLTAQTSNLLNTLHAKHHLCMNGLYQHAQHPRRHVSHLVVE